MKRNEFLKIRKLQTFLIYAICLSDTIFGGDNEY